MKNEVFYKELREKSKSVSQDLDTDKTEGKEIINSCKALLELYDTVRKEGLLSLLEKMEDGYIQGLLLSAELSHMLEHLVDGYEPDEIEETAMKRFFSRDYKGIEGFVFLLYLDSTIKIQSGVNPRVFTDNISSLLPEALEKRFNEYLKEIEDNRRSEIEAEKTEKRVNYNNTGSAYYLIRLVDYCIINADPVIIKELVEAEKFSFPLLMKVLSGAAVKKIDESVSNDAMSKLLSDLEYMGPVRMLDIEKEADAVLKEILRLRKTRDFDIPDLLTEIFDSPDLYADLE